jgi:hypothetical protein
MKTQCERAYETPILAFIIKRSTSTLCQWLAVMSFLSTTAVAEENRQKVPPKKQGKLSSGPERQALKPSDRDAARPDREKEFKAATPNYTDANEIKGSLMFNF